MSRTYSFWVKPKKANNGWVFVYSHSNFFYTETLVDNQSVIRIYRHKLIGRLFSKLLKKPMYSNHGIADVRITLK